MARARDAPRGIAQWLAEQDRQDDENDRHGDLECHGDDDLGDQKSEEQKQPDEPRRPPAPSRAAPGLSLRPPARALLRASLLAPSVPLGATSNALDPIADLSLDVLADFLREVAP
jgi:hypothetical protein